MIRNRTTLSACYVHDQDETASNTLQKACPTVFGKFVPQELLDMILDNVNDQGDLHSCCLVNSMWCNAAIFKLWEQVSFRHTRSIHQLDRLLQDQQQQENHHHGLEFGLSTYGHRNSTRGFAQFMNEIVTPATQQLATVFHIPLPSPQKPKSIVSSLSRLVRTLDMGSLKAPQSWLQTVHLAKAINRILATFPVCDSLILPPIHINQLNRIFLGMDGQLRHLDLSHIPGKCYDAVLSALPQYCPNIQSLVFGPHLCFGSTIRESNLQRLGKGMTRLTSIEIHGGLEGDCKNNLNHFHRSTLPYLFKACSNLRRVSIYKLSCPEFRTIAQILARFNPLLESLVIHLSTPGASWSDQTLFILSKYCTRLRHLELSPSHAVTSAGLFYLSLRCRQMDHMAIIGSLNTVVSGVISFLTNMTNLTYLDLSGYQGLDISLVYSLQRAMCTDPSRSSNIITTKSTLAITLKVLIMNGVFRNHNTQSLIIPSFHSFVRRFLNLSHLEFTIPVTYKSQGTFSCDVPHLSLKHGLVVDDGRSATPDDDVEMENMIQRSCRRPSSGGTTCDWCTKSDSVCLHVCMKQQSLMRFRTSPCPIIRVIVT